MPRAIRQLSEMERPGCFAKRKYHLMMAEMIANYPTPGKGTAAAPPIPAATAPATSGTAAESPSAPRNVVPAGNGTGTVTSSPVGLTCGATCAFPFAKDSMVTLTAVANADSDFTGWSGACTGTGACVVTMSSNRTVTATFTLKVFNVTSVISGGCAREVVKC